MLLLLRARRPVGRLAAEPLAGQAGWNAALCREQAAEWGRRFFPQASGTTGALSADFSCGLPFVALLVDLVNFLWIPEAWCT